MLFNLLAPYADQFQVFNLFRYLTFRTGGALMTGLFLSFLLGPAIIKWLKSQQGAGQPIRAGGSEPIFAKADAPAMGGFLILLALCLSTLLWADLMNAYVRIMMFVTIGFGAVGFADDYLKLSKRKVHALSGKVKLALGVGIAGLAGWFAMNMGGPALAVPFLKDMPVPVGVVLVSFAIIVIVVALNAVNRTDARAMVPVMIAAACFGFVAYLASSATFASALKIVYVPGTGELAVFCGALIGASLGFLRRTTAGRG